MIDVDFYTSLSAQLATSNTSLVAVSKTKPNEAILALYDLGQRDFGENYVQELVDKQAQLPNDIRWHFIGHLQSNKVKYIAPFVHLIHGVDSLKLLKEINKQALKCNRVIDCLLQVHIAQEETKFGLDEADIQLIAPELQHLRNIRILGYMGMASFTDDRDKVKAEFNHLTEVARLNNIPSIVYRLPSTVFSFGMSTDYELAIECGSNMVRIGSLLFGARS